MVVGQPQLQQQQSVYQPAYPVAQSESGAVEEKETSEKETTEKETAEKEKTKKKTKKEKE